MDESGRESVSWNSLFGYIGGIELCPCTATYMDIENRSHPRLEINQ